MTQEYRLLLFVTGHSERARTIAATVERLLNTRLESPFDLEVVDVLRDPQRADAENILMTPTLVVKLPPPERRVFGELEDMDKLWVILDFAAPGL